MEVQMAAQASKSTGRGSTPSDPHHGGGGAVAKPVPGYLRPSTGSCHHVCKYGGTHTFEDHKEAHRDRAQLRPPRKQQPSPAPAPAPAPAESHNHSRVLVKVRSVFRRRVVDSATATTQKPSKAAAGKAKAAKSSRGGDGVEWKDIVAYDTAPLPSHGSSPGPQLDKTSAHRVTDSGGDAKKKDVKKSYGKAKVHEQVDGVEGRQDEPLDTTNASTDSNKSVRPPKAKNKPAALLVEDMGIDQETLQAGYQTVSPSLVQSRANLLRDLEKEMMVEEPNNVKQESTPVTYSLDPEEYAAATAESSSRPIPAHRRVQSMSISSRSVRQPFARQASRNSVAFKLRSKSTRAPAVLPPEEEKPARLRSRRGEDPSSASTGRGIHLRIRSLRRRGVGGSGGAGTGGFVVPAVALRHQKTLEKKSQRLYNSHIEETATKLVKTRKSRVKALVGAFESVISKIAK